MGLETRLLAAAFLSVVWTSGAGGQCERSSSAATHCLTLIERSRPLKAKDNDQEVIIKSVVVRFCRQAMIQVNLSKEEEFEALPDLRMGIHVPDCGNVSVFTTFGPFSGYETIYSTQSGPSTISNFYDFSDLIIPFHFNVTFCEETDCPRLMQGMIPVSMGTQMMEELTTPAEGVVCSGETLLTSDNRVKLDVARPLPTGLVTGIRAYACAPHPFRLQVWDRVRDAMYEMVWERWIFPPATDGRLIQVDFDPSEHFTTKSTYRAALYLDGKGAKIPIPARFRSGAGMVFSLSDGNFRRCQNEAFELLPFPTEFLMEFCTSSGCSINSNYSLVTESSATDNIVADLCSQSKRSPLEEVTVTDIMTSSLTPINVTTKSKSEHNSLSTGRPGNSPKGLGSRDYSPTARMAAANSRSGSIRVHPYGAVIVPLLLILIRWC